MKPHVIMHMAISIDGRIVPTPWPEQVGSTLNDIYERIHRDLKGDAWLVGRVTMAEFAEGEPLAVSANETFPRTTWKAPNAGTGPFAIAIDAGGKLHLNRARVNGDKVVCILTESIGDDHLAELRRDNISYTFAGSDEVDLKLALERLNTDFGINRLLLEGGGGINGSFLATGLIDEMSVLIVPVADGSDGPTLFTSGAQKGIPMALDSLERLERDFVHLRYIVKG
jgi:riboflavin biosynthesis pyrimidine reductase